MHLSWHGHYTLKIQAGDVTLLIDPLSPETGLPAGRQGLQPVRGKIDIVALSNPSDPTMSYLEGVSEAVVFNSPGEYETAGMAMRALAWQADDGSERSLMRWHIEDMMLLHVGALNRELSDPELQELEKTDIDVLVVPVGGGSGLTTKQALDLVTTVEPRVVVPIHYHLPNIKEKLEPIDTFAKEMGLDPKGAEKKVVLKASKLPTEDVLTVLLAP